MTTQAPDLEGALIDAYGDQLQRYQAAFGSARTIVATFEAGRDATKDLEQLQRFLDEVADHEGAQRELRRQWDSLGRQPSERLRNVVRQLEQVIRQMIECIHRAEQLARESCERLTPELNIEARSLQMRTAYEGVDRE